MTVHITPHKEGWQVKTGGKKKAYRVVDTQKKAIDIGRTVAKNNKSDTKIHNKKGRIRDGNFYGDR